MSILRVFPRKTAATPDDELAVVGSPDLWRLAALDGVDEIHVSVTFTYDKPRAEQLAEEWTAAGLPVKVGGPAYGDRMGDFTPGLYMKQGYTFTSRGCPNNCWFCSVARCAHGTIRELPIQDGWIVCDDNILATREEHFRAVIEMLKRQPQSPAFVGGLEAKILQPWQAELLHEVKPSRLYCAYDTPDDYEPLVQAGKLFREAGFSDGSHSLCCYVLIGWKGDTFDAAEKRLTDTIHAGFMPFAMLYKDEKGNVNTEWRRFQREWCRPIIVANKFREIRRQQ